MTPLAHGPSRFKGWWRPHEPPACPPRPSKPHTQKANIAGQRRLYLSLKTAESKF